MASHDIRTLGRKLRGARVRPIDRHKSPPTSAAYDELCVSPFSHNETYGFLFIIGTGTGKPIPDLIIAERDLCLDN